MMMFYTQIARGVSVASVAGGGGGGLSVLSELYSTTAPVVSVTTTQDTLPTVGAQTTTSFSSTQPGHWEIASNVPGATISQASDGLSATITWTPQAYPICSIYIAARCINAGGSSIGVCRAHPGMRGVIQVGTGGDYSTLTAAFAAVKAFANPGGYAFVVKNGTYTAQNMWITYEGQSSAGQPPAGEYTTDNSGTDPLYTISRFTSVIAETPFGVVYDGQGVGYGNQSDLGIQLWGNTDLETYERTTMGWDNIGASGGVSNLRGIHIAGFVTKDTGGGGWNSYFVDHVFYEYGISGEVSRLDEDVNNSALQFQKSKDCVMENMHSFGQARYNQSSYESKRLSYRRLFGRKDAVKTNEPHGGVIPYRARDFQAVNILHFDADQLEEFDTSPGLSRASQDVGFLGIAATGVHDYPRTHSFSRALMFNCRLGLSENDAYDVTSALTDFTWDDVGAWYYKPNDQEGAGSGIGTWGPSIYNRLTSVYCDNVDSTYGANTWRKRIDVNDSVIAYYGHQYDGAGRGVNNFGYNDSTTNYFHLTNVTNYGMSVATEMSGGGAGYVKTNVDTTTNPFTQGVRYPGRLEASSAYDTASRGQKNFYKAAGLRGYNYGMTGYNTETGQNWLAEAMLELALPHYRAYSYTGSTNTLGTQTLSGDRGGAQEDRGLIDYIIAKDDRDVPFPLSVGIQTISGGHRLSWRQFASYYMTNITAFKVYQNGTLIHTTTSKNMHGADIAGLTTGASITVTAVDSVFGESGHSFAVTVP